MYENPFAAIAAGGLIWAPMTSTGVCTVGPLPLSARWQGALHLNSVAGELFGLVPAFRRAHVDLRIWLARDHPSNRCVVPDILRTDWESGRDSRAFAVYLQHELGVMTEHPVVARSSVAAWMR